ncbi:MAG: DUF4184 family protein [Gemmatimonadota bacterium]
MPFTLAHPAAALPIWYASRRHLRLAALIIGAATPDYEYFLHLNTVGHFAHTLPGLITVCLPAGWLSLWLFDRYGRMGAERLLPPQWKLRLPSGTPFFSTSCAILLGALTHIAWDGLTHPNGWGVRLLPQLEWPAYIGPLIVPWFTVLQHVSTILGLIVLTAATRRWVRRQPSVPTPELIRRALLPVLFLILAGVLTGLRFLPRDTYQFVSSGGVGVTLAFGVGLVILGFLEPEGASESR